MLARVIRPIPAGAKTIPISQEPIDVSGWLNADALVKARYIELITIPATPEMLAKPTLSFESDPNAVTDVDNPQGEEEPALGALAKLRGRPKRVTDN